MLDSFFAGAVDLPPGEEPEAAAAERARVLGIVFQNVPGAGPSGRPARDRGDAVDRACRLVEREERAIARAAKTVVDEIEPMDQEPEEEDAEQLTPEENAEFYFSGLADYFVESLEVDRAAAQNLEQRARVFYIRTYPTATNPTEPLWGVGGNIGERMAALHYPTEVVNQAVRYIRALGNESFITPEEAETWEREDEVAALRSTGPILVGMRESSTIPSELNAPESEAGEWEEVYHDGAAGRVFQGWRNRITGERLPPGVVPPGGRVGQVTPEEEEGDVPMSGTEAGSSGGKRTVRRALFG